MEFERAKEILNQDRENKYTDEEISEILNFLTILAEVAVKNILRESRKKKLKLKLRRKSTFTLF